MSARNDNGFTLIELIITSVVLASMAMAFFGIFNTVRVLNSRSNNLTIATEAVQEQIEKYRNQSYSDIPLGTVNTTSQLAPFPALGSSRSSSATVTSVDAAGLKKLVVTLNYRDGGKPKSMSVATLIALNGLNK